MASRELDGVGRGLGPPLSRRVIAPPHQGPSSWPLTWGALGSGDGRRLTCPPPLPSKGRRELCSDSTNCGRDREVRGSEWTTRDEADLAEPQNCTAQPGPRGDPPPISHVTRRRGWGGRPASPAHRALDELCPLPASFRPLSSPTQRSEQDEGGRVSRSLLVSGRSQFLWDSVSPSFKRGQ